MDTSHPAIAAPFSWGRFFSGSLMVFGTAVGAGMLGIPLMTAKAGFGPATIITLLVWLFMMATGLLLLEVTFRMPKGANFISLSSELLGKKGKWITIFFFLFLYYAFLVAYFSGGAPLLGECLSFFHIPRSSSLELGLFVTIFGGIVLGGSRMIHRTNAFLSIVMLVVFPALIFLGSQDVRLEKLFTQERSFPLALGAIPVLFGAFGYHNVIPSLSNHLGRDKKVLRWTVVFGTFLAFLLYTVWQWLVLGSLSFDALESVLKQGLPVTYALSQGASSKVFVLGQIFAFLALTTSFLGISFSLVDFIRDGLEQGKRKFPRWLYVILALAPPLFCVCINPHLFDKALGIAGGFGETLLNGILPVLLFAKVRPILQGKHKLLLGAFLLFSLGVMGIELTHLI